MKKHREKDAYAYKVEILDGVEMFTVEFKDGEGRLHEISVNREVFLSLKQLQLADNRRAYKDEFYVSHFIEDVDDDISYIAFAPLPSVEDEIITKDLADVIAEVISKLTDKQRRRFLMYRLDCLTYKEIAVQERCSKVSVHRSVQIVEKKITEAINKFNVGG